MASAVISQSLVDVVKTLSTQHDELDTVAVNMFATGKSLATRKKLLEEEDFVSELSAVNDSLYKTVESMVKLKCVINGVKKLDADIKSRAITAAEVETVQKELQASVSDVFNSISDLSVRDVQKHERFQKWSKLYKQCGGTQGYGEEEDESDMGSDVEVDAERDDLPSKCPISHAPFTEPVYNKVCKHIFDLRSVKSLMKGKSTISCPTAGCSHTVSLSGLVQHKELSLMIEREQDGDGAPTPTNRSARSRGGKSRSRQRGQVISDDDSESD